MKRLKRFTQLFVAVLFVLSAAVVPIAAQSTELVQGTQVELRLLTGLSTAVARSGDPFIAEVAQPVYLGTQLVLPAGARVHGTVGGVIHTRRLSMFRGEAAMNLTFQQLELDSRLFPAKMSIVRLQSPATGDKPGKNRKDVKVDEGQVVEAKHDIKGDLIAGTIGTAGGTVAGAVFSHVGRGFGLGLIGSTAYVMMRKGKELELPAQSVILVRMDNSVRLPVLTTSNLDSLEPVQEASR